MSHSSNFINFVHTVVNGSSLANIFSTTRLMLIEHLIYLRHFVLFNCLKLMFVIVDFLCCIVVLLLKKKKKEGKKVIVFKSIFSSFCIVF